MEQLGLSELRPNDLSSLFFLPLQVVLVDKVVCRGPSVTVVADYFGAVHGHQHLDGLL